MSWIIKASTSMLAAGAILLSAGCSSKKDVAIAAKDDTIRRQEAEISEAEANHARAEETARTAAAAAQQNAEVNRQLAAQNNLVIERNQEVQRRAIENQNMQTQRIVALTTEVSELDGIIKNMPKGQTVVISQPGPVPEGMGGSVSKRSDGSIHIQVAGSVLFESGRAELRSSAAETLAGVAHSIRSRYPNHAIRIEGHTDSTPVVHARDRYPDNMALSQARAAAVYDFLGKHGVSNRMYTAGYGDRQPLVSPEKCAADRSKNRRVEIVILPNNLNVQKETLSQNGTARPFHAKEEASVTAPKKNANVVAASAPAPAN